MVRTKTSSAMPTSSAATTVRAMSSTRSSSGRPPCSGPISASAPTSTAANAMRAALCASTIAVRSIVTPGLAGSTRNRLMPPSSSSAPAVRATTISRPAAWPSTTKVLRPSSRKPPPLGCAVRAIDCGWCLDFSSSASAATSEPRAIAGSHFACCSGEAPPASSVAPITALDRNGNGVSVCPSASPITPASTAPSPSPPWASGISVPVKPSPAKRCHSAGE